jgi:hypothetical protein
VRRCIFSSEGQGGGAGGKGGGRGEGKKEKEEGQAGITRLHCAQSRSAFSPANVEISGG